ncbi:MAG: hypothetical protein HQ537_02655 [Parcubacteria group bacterium]|nr:hypothetical protein [Parcubacteria group bacterium]
MGEHDDCKCPDCGSLHVSFLKIKDVGKPEEETFFLCRLCEKEFSIKSLGRNLGPKYLPSLVSILKEKYPP